MPFLQEKLNQLSGKARAKLWFCFSAEYVQEKGPGYICEAVLIRMKVNKRELFAFYSKSSCIMDFT